MFRNKRKNKKAAKAAAAAAEPTTPEDIVPRSTSSLSVPAALLTTDSMRSVCDHDASSAVGSDGSQDTIAESVSLNGQQSPLPTRFHLTEHLPPNSQTGAVTSLLKKIHSQPAMPAQNLAASAGNDYKPVAQIIRYQSAPTTEHKEQQTTLKAMAQPLDPKTAELIASAVSFGLGRGIDATSQTPWANKSSFQIRRVQQTIVETIETGTEENYEHEVLSTVDIEEKLRSSLEPRETPLNINVESESTRNSHHCLKRTVGRRVVSRTIAFQTDYEERAMPCTSLLRADDSLLLPKDPTEVVFNAQNSHLTFEERVSEWICHRIARKQYLLDGRRVELSNCDSPTDQLAKLLHAKALQRVEDEVSKGCKELIEGLRVTHYISSIKLGAAQYCVMSDGEYHKKMARAGAFGLDAIVESITTPQSPSSSKKTSNTRQLGFIKSNGRVERGSENESVLEFTVQPITRLIRLPVLKSALQQAVKLYMKATVDPEGGPFVIKSVGKEVYLTVNRFNSYEVEGTEVTAEASLFHFIPADTSNSFNYHIAYYGEDIGSSEEHSPHSAVCYYLEAPIDSMGKHNHTLYMKQSVKTRQSRFTLRSRLAKKHTNCTPGSLLSGDNAFYIACATKKLQHGSYLGLKSSKKSSSILGTHFYTTACYPSIHQHDGDTNTLLFQLIPKCRIPLKEAKHEASNGTATPVAVTPNSPLHTHTAAIK